MQAAVVHQWGGPEQLVLETVADPTPSPDHAVVELKASAVNWHDILVRRSGRGFPLLASSASTVPESGATPVKKCSSIPA